MPELPEVEVVRSTLEPVLKNLKIKSIQALYPPIIEQPLEEFKRKVENKKILRIDRYAKYLIFILEDGAFLSHLRMEGKYFYVEESKATTKHDHVIFHFDNGYKLVYNDVRKFGRISYRTLEELFQVEPLNRVGIEANASNYDISELLTKLKHKTIPIKTMLLDQSFISGLGNIYVDEVLYRAKIHPLRKSSSIQNMELEQILKASQWILNQAIEQKGSTIRSYTSSLGVEGNYQNFLEVHTKTICPGCHKTLEKIKIGGRMSYFCKNCQR